MRELGTVQVIQGDARALPLPDASVDLICTSPPYFALRAYQDAGETYANQMGSEATPAEFLGALLAATAEMVRVLKPTGSIFVNLGDKYAAGHGGSSTEGNGVNINVRRTRKAAEHWTGADSHPSNSTAQIVPGFRPKTLMGMPWRYAIQCIDQLGLILRAEIIWAKPNGLPESVTDRVRRSHETWFHFTKQARYFSAVDEIREPQTEPDRRNSRVERMGRREGSDGDLMPSWGMATREYNPLGKLPGSVWSIPTQPLTVPPELGVDHFAAYPMEWPRRIIQGWTPNGVCVDCGEGRRPARGMNWDVVPHRLEWRRNREHTETDRRRFGQLFTEWQEAAGIPSREIAALFPSVTGGLTGCVANWRYGYNVMMPDQRDAVEAEYGKMPDALRSVIGDMAMLPVMAEKIATGPEGSGKHRNTMKARDGTHTITGYMCGCPTPTAPTTPAVCLDPFGGTGTTALVAKALGRTGITIDLSRDYCRLAEWRCNDPRELAAALQVEKPDPVHPDQLDLFSGIE